MNENFNADGRNPCGFCSEHERHSEIAGDYKQEKKLFWNAIERLQSAVTTLRAEMSAIKNEIESVNRNLKDRIETERNSRIEAMKVLVVRQDKIFAWTCAAAGTFFAACLGIIGTLLVKLYGK